MKIRELFRPRRVSRVAWLMAFVAYSGLLTFATAWYVRRYERRAAAAVEKASAARERQVAEMNRMATELAAFVNRPSTNMETIRRLEEHSMKTVADMEAIVDRYVAEAKRRKRPEPAEPVPPAGGSDLACVLLAPDAPKAEASAADRAALQGGWYLIEFTADGMTLKPAAPPPEPSMVIEDDRLILYGHPLGRYTIDAGKSPKWIDQIFERGADAGKRAVGIYKLEDGVLTICAAEAPAPRPDDFTAKKGSKRRLSVYNRKP